MFEHSSPLIWNDYKNRFKGFVVSVLIELSMKESYIFWVDQRKNDTFFEYIAAIFAEVSVYLIELKFVRKKVC